MAAGGDPYDALAEALKTLHERFGTGLFSDRRRLVSLLFDMLPDAKRDIRLVGTAVDEGIPASLAGVEPHLLGVEMDRQSSKLEGSTGLRPELACQMVRVFAYAMGKGPLPSVYGVAAPVAPSQGEWAGLSVPAAAPQAPVHPGWQPHPGSVYPQGSYPAAPAPAGAVRIGGYSIDRKHLIGIAGAAAAVLAATQLFSGGGTMVNEVTPVVDNGIVPPAPDPVVPDTDAEPRPKTDTTQREPGDAAYADELADHGVAAKAELESNVGSPTPLEIPGGRRVTTGALRELLRREPEALLIDVLANPHPMTLRDAVYLPQAGLPGSFRDSYQRETETALERATGGKKNRPLIFFCAGAICWESYNAVLRAREAGFRNLYWYRGGLASWTAAGLPMQPLPAQEGRNFIF